MDDLAVGTEFYYKGSLCKVFEVGHEYDYDKCSRCDMSLSECSIMNCASGARKDSKSVYFKWIEDTEDTEDIEDAKDNEDTKDTEEAMNEVTTSTECCRKEKTLEEEINELKIEESLKERIFFLNLYLNFYEKVFFQAKRTFARIDGNHNILYLQNLRLNFL